MTGNLALKERDGLFAGTLPKVVLAQARPGLVVTDVNRDGALEVRQAEVVLAIAAIGRAEEGEERRVRANRQQRAVAERPAAWREVVRTVRIWPR